jgi:hypothetical protein
MANLQKEPDTIISPEDALTERMKLEGTTNDLDHNQFTSADEVDLLGDGVPGYETTGVDGTDDEVEEQLEQRRFMIPRPKITP